MEVLILNQTPRGERDAIVTMLGGDGEQYQALAKGIREMPSRLRAGLLPLVIADAELIAGRSGWIARSTAPLLDIAAVRENPTALAGARMAAAVLQHVSGPRRGDMPRFAHATRILRDLNTAVLAGETNLLLRRRAVAAWVAALDLVGYFPEFRYCVTCREGVIAGLHVEHGGVVCTTHTDNATHMMRPEDLHLLQTRHVPHHADAVHTLVQFLSAFTSIRIPAAAGESRWAMSELCR